MHILCGREQLLQAVNFVQRAVSPRNPLPILGSILLEASGNALFFTATDLELTIRTDIEAEVISEGRIALPARYFIELVRKLPEGTVELKKEEGGGVEKIWIKYPRAEVELNGFDPDQYPLLPGPEGGFSLKIESSLLKNAISKVSIAVSRDDSRKVFTGIYLEFQEEALNLVATDTHRLAWKKIKKPGGGKEGPAVLVPGRSLQEVSRLLGNQEDIEVAVGNTQISFKLNNAVITSRLIEGQYPKYAQLIPENFETRVRVNAKEFLEAAERVSLLSQEETRIRSNIIRLEIGKNNLSVSSSSNEIGSIRENVPIFTEGEEKEINFNARYLLDILKVLGDSDAYLEIGGQRSPGVFRPADGEDYLCLVLPIRLTGTPTEAKEV